MCEQGGPRQQEALARLDRGDAARSVAERLRDQYLEEHGRIPFWLGFMLDDTPKPQPPTRQRVLDQLDAMERKEGSSEELGDARRQVLEAPDEFFGEA